MEIYIISNDGTFTSQELKERFEELPGWDGSITLVIPRLRTMDPTVLAAIFTMTGTALGALISGLLRIAQTRAKDRIVVELEGGRKLELEGPDISKLMKDVPKLMELLKGTKKIEI